MAEGFGNISQPGKTAAQQALGRGGQLIQIISVPKQLSNVAKAIRLAGEITHFGKAGVIRITTTEGEVEAKVKGNKPLQQGQKVEVEIPPGRPPRQATLRQPTSPVPEQQTGRGTLNTPAPTVPRDNFVRPETNFLRPEGHTPPVRGQSIPPEIRQQLAQQVTANNITAQPQPRPLTTEAVVRLLSVPPVQAQAIATEFAQTLTVQPAALARVPFTANLIVQNVQGEQTSTLLQIKSPPAPQTPLIQTTQNTPQPVLNNNFFQTPIITQTQIIPPPQTPPTSPLQIITPQITNAPQVIPATQLLPAASAQTILQTPPVTAQQLTQPIQTTLTPTPVTFDPANPVRIPTSTIERIDIQVVRITPPSVLITTPSPAITPATTPVTPTISATTPPITQIQTPIISSTPQAAQIIPATTQFTQPLVSANTAATVTAKVTGFTAQGLPLVTVPWPGRSIPQSFVMQFNSNNLQLGSQIQIIPKTPVMLPVARAINPLLQGFQWPALDQLYSTLAQISPQAAASMTRTLPTPTSAAQIGPAAMMFIAAVKSGDIGGWLGERKIDLIQRANRDNILSRLVQDTSSQTTRTAEPASSGEWRAVPLPMFWEGEIQKITLYTRREDNGQQQDQDENGQTRFIFDLSLSRMGDVQLDGLLRDKRLDLVVRTQNAFSQPMQQTMRQAYTNALDHTELHGDLNFQGNTNNWIHVLEKEEQLGVEV